MKKQSDSLGKKISLPGSADGANLVICENLSDLSAKAADLLESSMKKERFSLVLSGGSTPRAVHEVLSKRQIKWDDVSFFWGDERCVPPEHSESNYRMANETLLSRIAVAESRIFRMHGEWEPRLAAEDYEAQIRAFFRIDNMVPSFDFVFLGLGEDCHTASLFPNTTAGNIQDRLVVSNHVEKLRSTRLTMTFPLFNKASTVVFLVSGESKAAALKTVLEGPFDPHRYPAQGIRPESGDLYFFVEPHAARLLDNVDTQ